MNERTGKLLEEASQQNTRLQQLVETTARLVAHSGELLGRLTRRPLDIQGKRD
jgi:hypothetical protein